MESESSNVSVQEYEMSVVVAIIEGGDTAVETCLKALEKGNGEIRLECIVPFDARLERVEEVRKQFPWVKFLDVRDLVQREEFGDAGREHHDILRAIGLRNSSAPIVALLEDHGTPSRGWCKAVLKAHRDSNAAAIGGAVENGVDRWLNWAVYYCDFGRYQNPVPDDEVDYLSDSNVSYKREPLWSVERVWSDAFHETSVNWELKRRGEVLRLDPNMVVYQTRRRLLFSPALGERYVWGRSFAGTRALEVPVSRRTMFAAFSFLLPFALTARILSNGLRKGRHLRDLLLALPLILLLETVWAMGEFVGYVTARASAEGRPGKRVRP